MADFALSIVSQLKRKRMGELLAYVRSGQPDLTNRQMAAMMLVYWTGETYTVRRLAQALGVSKPVVTRILNTLAPLDLLRRVPDPRDRRNLFIAGTDAGLDFMERVHG